MPECVDSTTYLFADDTKIFREIKSPNNEEKLQNDLDELQKWSDTWLVLKFHPNKCKVLTVSNRKMAEKEANTYHLYDNEGKEVKLERSDGEKDIGVLVDETISFSTHIQNQINIKANSIMGLIRRTYTYLYLDEQSFKYLFQAQVRPHHEYSAAVWSPYKSGEIKQIENVQ